MPVQFMTIRWQSYSVPGEGHPISAGYDGMRRKL